MTTVAVVPDAPAPAGQASATESERGGRPRSLTSVIARQPVWRHAVVLLVVLTACIPVIGTRGQFHDDEGAALLQTEMLVHGEGWTRPFDFSLDRQPAVGAPIYGALGRTSGWVPYGKHVAYPVLLVPFDAVAGVGGVLFASVLGAVLAALVAARIGERLRPGSAVVCFWATALGSPLFFDGLIAEAHAIGAALAGAFVLAVLGFVERPRWSVGAAGVAALVGLVLLRSEGVLLALACAAAVAVTIAARRSVALATTALAIAAIAAIVHLGEPRLTDVILPGHDLPGPAATGGGGVVVQRAIGAYTTLLQGGYGPVGAGFVLSFLAAALVVATGLVVRRRPTDVQGIAVFGGAASVAFAARLVVAPAGAIPSLLLTCPVVLFGLVVVTRGSMGDEPHRIAGVTVVLFVAAVLATQYGIAGAHEWGWRYVAIALPLAVPLAVDSAMRALERVPRPGRTAVTVMLVAGSLSLVGVGVATLVSDHRASADEAAMTVAAVRSGAAGPTGSAVVVMTYPPVGRYAWRDLDEARFAIVDHSDLASVAPQLGSAGIERWLLVTDHPERDVPLVTGNGSAVREVGARAGVHVFAVDDHR